MLFGFIIILLVPEGHVKLPEIFGVNVSEGIEFLLLYRRKSRDSETLEMLFIVQISSQLLQAVLWFKKRLLYCLLHQESRILRVLQLALSHQYLIVSR